MSTTPEPVAKPDNADRVGLYATAVAAGVGFVAVLITTISRLVEVAPGHNIPVTVKLEHETLPVPLGPNGSPIDGIVSEAVVNVVDPAPATLFALWAEPLTWGITWMALLVIGGMLCMRFARAQVFNRTTYRLVYAASAVLTAGWMFGSVFSNMTVNGALSAVSDYTYEVTRINFNLAAVIGIIVLAAIGTAIQLGEKLQRETEGLV